MRDVLEGGSGGRRGGGGGGRGGFFFDFKFLLCFNYLPLRALRVRKRNDLLSRSNFASRRKLELDGDAVGSIKEL